MDGRMNNMNQSMDWNMNRNMGGMDRFDRMDRMVHMDMNWMEGMNDHQYRSQSNSICHMQSANFDY